MENTPGRLKPRKVRKSGIPRCTIRMMSTIPGCSTVRTISTTRKWTMVSMGTKPMVTRTGTTRMRQGR